MSSKGHVEFMKLFKVYCKQENCMEKYYDYAKHFKKLEKEAKLYKKVHKT